MGILGKCIFGPSRNPCEPSAVSLVLWLDGSEINSFVERFRSRDPPEAFDGCNTSPYSHRYDRQMEFSPEIMASSVNPSWRRVRRDMARRLQGRDMPVTEIAELLGVTRQTVHKYLRR